MNDDNDKIWQELKDQIRVLSLEQRETISKEIDELIQLLARWGPTGFIAFAVVGFFMQMKVEKDVDKTLEEIADKMKLI